MNIGPMDSVGKGFSLHFLALTVGLKGELRK